MSLERTRYANDVDRDEMLRVLRAFEQEKLEYVLIGAAAAMGFHGLVRTWTRSRPTTSSATIRPPATE